MKVVKIIITLLLALPSAYKIQSVGTPNDDDWVAIESEFTESEEEWDTSMKTTLEKAFTTFKEKYEKAVKNFKKEKSKENILYLEIVQQMIPQLRNDQAEADFKRIVGKTREEIKEKINKLLQK